MPHIHEKIDFTAEVYVVHKNKVLLRIHDKYGIWLSVGGHIELDEDPNQAAIREVKEEVGLEIALAGDSLHMRTNPDGSKELLPPRFMNRHNINETHEHVVMIYFARSDSDVVIPENDKDVWQWFTKEELQNPKYNLKENIRFYAEQALAELGN